MRLALLVLLAACSGKGDTGTGTPSGTVVGTTTTSTSTAPLSHDVDIQPVWDKHCGSSCHVNDDDGGLSLSDAYDKIVSVPSVDVPAMALVEPGDPDASYLWLKLDNTHLAAGGAGTEMPRGTLSLGKAKRNKIERWILEGAVR